MKSHRLMLSVVLMSLCSLAFAQSDVQKSSVTPVPSEAQKSFAIMKTLAGSWEGPVTTAPQAVEVEGKPAQILLRVTSRGNALMHDLTIAGIPTIPLPCFTWIAIACS